MSSDLAPAITKAASSQTYYTIRFLVDRPRVADAYRAYAYFRWLDDVLDADEPCGPPQAAAASLERRRLLGRQKALLNRCLGGEEPRDVNGHEALLVDLVGHGDRVDSRLVEYVRHMMAVMDFDVRRRGRLVSADELNDYTRSLATAVTEAMHYFIGDVTPAPEDETRYLAVSGAHIVHMLRDTYSDVRAGYFNIPREVLEPHSIGPADVRDDAYREYVASRVRLARRYFDAGKAYFGRVESVRHRLAGLAYIARFEWLTETLEREDFIVRPEYSERNSLATRLRMGMGVLAAMAGSHDVKTASSVVSGDGGV